MFLVVLAPLLVLHGYTLYSGYRQAQERAQGEVLSRSRELARTVDSEFTRAENMLVLMAQRDELRPDTPERCQAFLQGMSTVNTLLVNIVFLDKQGHLLCSAVKGKMPPSYQEVPWFQHALNSNTPVIEAPVQGRITNNTIAVLARAVRNGAGEAVGVVALSMDLIRLSNRMGYGIDAQDTLVAMLDSRGVLLARYPDPADWIGKKAPSQALEQRKEAPEGVILTTTTDGKRRIIASTPMQHFGMRVTSGVLYEAVQAPLNVELQRSLGTAAGMLLLMCVLAWLGGRHLAQPLRQMLSTLRAQREGQNDRRMPEALSGEYRDVAVEFNRLMDAREASEGQWRLATRRAERLANFYAGLSGFNQVVMEVRSPQALYAQLCQLLVDTQHATVAWVGLVEGDAVRSVAWSGPAKAYAENMKVSIDELDPERWGPTAQAALSAKPVVVNDYLSDARTVIWRERAMRYGIRSAGAFPFLHHGKVAGVLNLYFNEPDFFDEGLTSVVQELTQEVTFALQNLTRDAARLQAAEALRKREQQLAAIIDNTSDAIFTVDTDLCVQVFNVAASHMFRIEPEDAQGELLTRFLPDCANQPGGPLVHGQTRQLRALRTDGTEFPAEMSISLSGQGRDIVATVVLRDLTRIREAEAARLERQKAESANLAKTQFIARMSHELRTPLNAVLGFTQLLQSSAHERLTEGEKRHLDLVFLAGAQLRALIDDVLDVSRLEAGTVSMDLQDVDLKALLGDALRMSEAHAAQRGVRMALRYGQSPRVIVRTDPMRLRQVLLNLLSNAIKYNRPGGQVVLGLEQLPNRLEITVADNGLGMTPEQLANIFQPFNRLGRERSDIEGTGIGMAICRQLVELMGGALTVESEAGKGTLVTVSLVHVQTEEDLALPALPPAATLPAPMLPAADETVEGTVLYIEDNPVNALLVEQVLTRWPAVKLLVAEDGQSGIRCAQERQPDLVLLDMQLPDMTGLEVLARLKASPQTAQLPVVALSASAMDSDVKDATQAGAVEYWTKPIDFQPFLEGVRRLLRQRRTNAS